MRLKELLAGCRVLSVSGSLESEISGIAYDSRKVLPGFAFVAVRGLQEDGNCFTSQAAANGASAIVSAMPAPGNQPVSWVQVENDRAALASTAANFYGRPTELLHTVGITGTNGKTTTAYLIDAVLSAAGHQAAVFGTIEYRGPGFRYAAERTTPEAPDLQALFRKLLDGGCHYAVMEVSSHAVALKRVEGLHFEVAVFTNLTRDHLDFHGDMRSYFLAKKKLFTGLDGRIPRVMVLNADDPNFDELRAIAPERTLSYGMSERADVFPERHDSGRDSGANVMTALYRTPAGEISIASRLMGTPNLYNIGAAIAASLRLGASSDAIRRGIGDLAGVPGRFEIVDAGQPFRVVVDYAHTDDALRRVLQSAREITKGKLVVVFGCGGDRDQSKRPLMGAAAAAGSDLAIVTSDNPRSEDPMSIIHQIESGIPRSSNYRLIADRRQAIADALKAAQQQDTVLIAGKGHEGYQITGDRTVPFDDRAVARELLDEFATGRN